MSKKISIIGLGYVGLPLAQAFKKYFRVCGFDINKKRIDELNIGFDRNNEIKKKELLKKKNIIFTNKIQDIKNSDFIIITVPTPITKNKLPDLYPLSYSCKLISKFIKKKSIIIFESTVYPSCTEKYCTPIIEKYSKMKFNRDFYIGYSPERINVGDKKHTLENIVKIVSGSDSSTLKKVSNLYSKIIKAGVYKCPNIMTAEAAKAIENAQRDINIAFINEVSVLFNKLNIKTSDVLNAAKTKWNFLNFVPGIVGGHCIGVDPYYLTFIAKQKGLNPKVILSGRNVNDNMSKTVSDLFYSELKIRFEKIKKFRVLILGVAFKENTNDIRNSKAFDVCKYLNRINIDVDLYDPLINYKLKNKYFNQLKTIKKDVKYHALLLLVPHREILKKIRNFKKNLYRKSFIYDFKNVINDKFFCDIVTL